MQSGPSSKGRVSQKKASATTDRPDTETMEFVLHRSWYDLVICEHDVCHGIGWHVTNGMNQTFDFNEDALDLTSARAHTVCQ